MNTLVAAVFGALGAVLGWRVVTSVAAAHRMSVLLGLVLVSSFLLGGATVVAQVVPEWSAGHAPVVALRAGCSGFASVGSIALLTVMEPDGARPIRTAVSRVLWLLAAGVVGAAAGYMLPSLAHVAVVKIPA